MSHNVTLPEATNEFLHFKTTTGLSENILDEFRNSLEKLMAYSGGGNFPIDELTADDPLSFFRWLREDYVTMAGGVAPRTPRRLSERTIRKVHMALSSMFTWAVDFGHLETHLLKMIPKPKAPKPKARDPLINPYESYKLEALLNTARYAKKWGGTETESVRPNFKRDLAIILMLRDTGVRGSELCRARIEDVNLDYNILLIRDKASDMDPGERVVQFRPRTGVAVWECVSTRESSFLAEAPLFAVGTEPDIRAMDRNVLAWLLKSLGKRAGVPRVGPQRSRDTFAIEYLRSDGDIHTLKSLLGHRSLDMVKRYERIADVTSVRCCEPPARHETGNHDEPSEVRRGMTPPDL